MKTKVYNKKLLKIKFIFFIFLSCILFLFFFAEMIFLIKYKNFYFKTNKLNIKYAIGSEGGLEINPLSVQNKSTLPIFIKNASFDNIDTKGSNFEWVLGYNTIIEPTIGYKDDSAIMIHYGELFQEKNITENFEKYGPLVLSAWIKSEFKNNAYVKLEVDGMVTTSNYHSGDGNWELISVISEKNINRNSALKVKVSLMTKAAAHFDDVKLILGRKIEAGGRDEYREKINIAKTKKIKILALGGSTTYSHTPIGLSWPYVLEQKLNSCFPDKYEVINLGRDGFTVRDILCYSFPNKFTQYGYLDLKPDIVIITPAWNDLMYGFAFPGNFAAANNFLRKNIFVRKTALGYFLYNFFYFKLFLIWHKIFFKEFTEYKSYSEIEDSGAKKRLLFLTSNIYMSMPFLAFKNNLEELINTYQNAGIKTILMTLPCIYGKDALEINTGYIMENNNIKNFNFPRQTIKSFQIVEKLDRAIIGSVAVKTKSKLIDCSKCFLLEYPTVSERLKFFEDESHFNAKGCTLLADFIFNANEFKMSIESVDKKCPAGEF